MESFRGWDFDLIKSWQIYKSLIFFYHLLIHLEILGFHHVKYNRPQDTKSIEKSGREKHLRLIEGSNFADTDRSFLIVSYIKQDQEFGTNVRQIIVRYLISRNLPSFTCILFNKNPSLQLSFQNLEISWWSTRSMQSLGIVVSCSLSWVCECQK